MQQRVFGHIAGVPVGSSFRDREAVHLSGVHRPTQAGISGSATEGADSIVVSGGYEDDEDHGDVIVYTGHGGRDPNSGSQVSDQELTRGNLALARSCDEGLPVRVIRGHGGHPIWSPVSGYRYDGLFYIDFYWREIGKAGFYVWRFRLIEVDRGIPEGGGDGPKTVVAERVISATQRLVRATAVGLRVKQLHNHVCQVCGIRLITQSGPYAEAVHIRPMGRPHDGPDEKGNLLCLCPNDHVLFERGALVINDDLSILNALTAARVGTLRSKQGHNIGVAHLAYRRALLAADGPTKTPQSE